MDENTVKNMNIDEVFELINNIPSENEFIITVVIGD